MTGAFPPNGNTRSVKVPEISMDEFKKKLKVYDTDKDGRISMEELREAIRSSGGFFSKVKARSILSAVDTNSNGFIDEDEMGMLVIFAQKQFGYKIVS